MTRRIAWLLVVDVVVLALAGVGWLLLHSDRDQVVATATPGAREHAAPPQQEPAAVRPRPATRAEPARARPAPPAPELHLAPSSTPAPAAGSATWVQQRLTELGYYVDDIDGEVGGNTVSAVMAFQKVNGLSADGQVGPRTLAALGHPIEPQIAPGPDRVEVDLDAQVAHLVIGGHRVRTMPVSSGNGETYQRANGGGLGIAVTPTGWFRIERRLTGVREAPLGTMYDPMYFFGGFALHGSNSVPPYPASHGCIRLTRSDALWLFARVDIGTHVHVVGGEHVFEAGADAPVTA